MRLSQGELAKYFGVARATISEATREGYKCKGYPVRSWAIYDGSGRVAGYEVPDHVMDQAAPAKVQQTLGLVEEDVEPVSSLEGARENAEEVGKSWADAAADVAPKVGAQVSSATVAYRYANVVEKHPGLGTSLFDLMAGLGMGGIGLAATDEDDTGRWWKVLASGMAGFFGMRVTRNVLDQRGSDRVERAQRKELPEGTNETANQERLPPGEDLQGRAGGHDDRDPHHSNRSSGVNIG